MSETELAEDIRTALEESTAGVRMSANAAVGVRLHSRTAVRKPGYLSG